jgi:Arc/MetJ-type ribon-helix-helix transcriptional regulator
MVDMRKFNGGARDGAGRPKTINGYRQVAVRLPEEMANWVLNQAVRCSGGSEAELLRKLISEAMEKDAANKADVPEPK